MQNKTCALLDECLTLEAILVLADNAVDKEGVSLPKPVPEETPMRKPFHFLRTNRHPLIQQPALSCTGISRRQRSLHRQNPLCSTKQ
jgi:hypothetical protein